MSTTDTIDTPQRLRLEDDLSEARTEAANLRALLDERDGTIRELEEERHDVRELLRELWGLAPPGYWKSGLESRVEETLGDRGAK